MVACWNRNPTVVPTSENATTIAALSEFASLRQPPRSSIASSSQFISRPPPWQRHTWAPPWFIASGLRAPKPLFFSSLWENRELWRNTTPPCLHLRINHLFPCDVSHENHRTSNCVFSSGSDLHLLRHGNAHGNRKHETTVLDTLNGSAIVDLQQQNLLATIIATLERGPVTIFSQHSRTQHLYYFWNFDIQPWAPPLPLQCIPRVINTATVANGPSNTSSIGEPVAIIGICEMHLATTFTVAKP